MNIDGANEALAKFKIPRELLEAAHVQHLTDSQVREALGVHGRTDQNLSGIVFPYRHPRDGRVVSHRVRLDVPIDGQKYLSAQGCRALFFAPVEGKELGDTSIPVVIVEAEKSALALSALASRHGRKLLAVATGGVWGWKRKTGTELQPDGAREPVSGPSPSLDWIIWKGRKVTIAFDSNIAGRRDLEKARRDFAVELSGRGAHVLIASVPRRDEINGPDDLIAVDGDATALEMIDKAELFTAAKPGAVLRCFSDIVPKALRWLWPGRIPLGKLTLLIGDPGLGKSLLTADIASRITRGAFFPDTATCESGSVIFLSAEDDPADTIRPRLDAAGADVSRVHTLEAVRVQLTDGSLTEKPFNLETDVAALEEAVREHPGVRLIVIDPISAYLGGVDSHSNAEVRGVLARLATLAAHYNVAVLCVTHLRKSAGAAVYRAVASIAFTAAARAVWAVAPDPEDVDRRLLLAVKQNLSANPGGLAFRIEMTHNNVARLAWETGTVALAANYVLGNVDVQQGQNERREAKEWLQDFLADGPVAVKKIQDEAKAAGLSWMTVRRAKEALAVAASKSGYQGKWEWRLEDAHSKHAHPIDIQVSIFEERGEKPNLSGNGITKDAQSRQGEHPYAPSANVLDDNEVRL